VAVVFSRCRRGYSLLGAEVCWLWSQRGRQSAPGLLGSSLGSTGKTAAVDVVQILRQIMESNLSFGEPSEDVKRAVLVTWGRRK